MSNIILFGSGVTPPTFTPSLAFNDTGGSGGGDRNSMYICVVMGLA